MEKRDNTPLWVSLAWANVQTRKGALVLVWCNILCCFYCIPWSRYFPEPAWLGKVFIIERWIWFALMVAITLWYWASFVWADRHGLWAEPVVEKD